MAFHITVTINEEQWVFLKESMLSPSKLFQEAINNAIKTKDTEEQD